MTGSPPLRPAPPGDRPHEVLFTWAYTNTRGGILAALLFHTSMNWAIWAFSPTMQANATAIGLTVLFLLVAVAAVVVVFDAKRLARTQEA